MSTNERDTTVRPPLIVVRDWDSDNFHRRVLELERQGYTARRETYRIDPEVNPDTGEIVHLHTIEMRLPE